MKILIINGYSKTVSGIKQFKKLETIIRDVFHENI